MMILFVALALLGMLAFYSLVAYLLIRLISKKAFKVMLTRSETTEIMSWLAIAFVAFVSIKSGSFLLLVICILLVASLRKLRKFNRDERRTKQARVALLRNE